MARKPSQPEKPKKRRRSFGVAGGVVRPMTREEKAMIWELTAAGFSQRKVAEEMGLCRTSVYTVLHSDPVGLEQIRADLREQRAERTKRLEGLGLDEAAAWLELAQNSRTELLSALRQKDQRKQKQALNRILAVLAVVPKMVQAARAAGADGAKLTQLLTGGVTERIGAPSVGEDLTTARALIDAARALGRLEDLPPAIRQAAEAEEAKAAQESADDAE